MGPGTSDDSGTESFVGYRFAGQTCPHGRPWTLPTGVWTLPTGTDESSTT